MTNDKSPKKGKRRLFFHHSVILASFGLRHECFVISSCVSQYFLDGGIASEDAAQAVLAQCYHSKLYSLLL
jgi:hypothetical protein